MLASEISQADWAYTTGGVYAVIYRDFFVIKRIKDNDIWQKGYLILHSDNIKSGNVTIPQEEIKDIWKITNIIDAAVE